MDFPLYFQIRLGQWEGLILEIPYGVFRVFSPFSMHRPSGPMLFISRNVCLSVRLYVCLSVCSLLRYHLTVFLPPLPEVGWQIFLETRNPGGKSDGKKWSNIWTFLFGSGRKSPRKKSCSLLILPYKTWWKPRFQMNKRPLVEGRIANFGISLDIFEFLRFGWFFLFFKKIRFLGILGSWIIKIYNILIIF